jgi:hypothetical protein
MEVDKDLASVKQTIQCVTEVDAKINQARFSAISKSALSLDPGSSMKRQGDLSKGPFSVHSVSTLIGLNPTFQ